MTHEEFTALPREQKDRLLWELIKWREAVYRQEATRRERITRMMGGNGADAEVAL